ncbi:MAG: hypothetical protein FWD65_05765 [Coriobacteriia bacterium]|nr:hypothetical protein [Coriobacteriia bacterium]
MSAKKITAPSSVPAAFVGAVVTLLISLPVMWLIGHIAAFMYGLGIWITPWLASAIGLHFLADKGTQGYQQAVIIFAVVAALQNAALVFWNQRETGASKILHITLQVLIGLTILGILAGLLAMIAL